MTAPMMTGMPTPPNALATNGHHPVQTSATAAYPAAPPSRTTAQQADLDRRRAEARAERLRLIETRGRFVRWLLKVIYGMVAIVAGIGQTTGLMTKLALVWYIAAVPMVATESLAIVFASVAAYRRMLGENAYFSYGLATFFSGFAVWVNWYGHHDTQPFLAWFFAVFSAAGFVVFTIETAFARRDHLWMQNKLDDPAPLYGLRLELTQPKLVARAKLHAIADPGLGRAGSLEAARVSLAADARRAAMKRLIDTDLRRVYGPEGAELLASVIDPDQLADEISAQAELGKLGGIYARRIDPQQIEEAHALERAERRKGRFARRKVALTATVPPPSETGDVSTPSQVGRTRTIQRPAGGGKRAEQGKRERVPADQLFRQFQTEQSTNPGQTLTAYAATLGVSASRLRDVRRQFGDTSSTAE